MPDENIRILFTGVDNLSSAAKSAASGLGVIGAAANNAKGHAGGLGSVLGGVANMAGTVMKAGLIAGAAGATALVAGLGACVKAAMEAQVVEAQLDAVLKSTGGVAGMTKDALVEMANSLSMIMPVEDEAIMAGQAMLLTFTNIGKDVFPDATQALLDMATAMNSGAAPSADQLKSSAIQLGKALNDPIAGVGALRRVGVQLTDSQEDLIKKMVETGDVMGAQKIILGELTKEFGGSAVAAGQTFAGSLTILKNSMGNVMETIGGALLPGLTQVAQGISKALADPAIQAAISSFASNIATGLGNVISWLTANWPQIQSIIKTVMDAVGVAIQFVTTTVLPVLVAGFQTIVGWVQANWPAIQGIIKTVMDAIGTAIQFVTTTILPVLIQGFQTIVSWVQSNWPQIQSIIKAVMDAVGTAIQFVTTTVLPVLITGFQSIVSWVQSNWPQIQETISRVMEVIGDIVQRGVEIISQFWWEHGEQIMGIIKNAWEIIQTVISTAIDVIKGIISAVMAIIRGDWAGAWEAIKGIVEAIWEGIKNIVTNGIDLAKGVIEVGWAAIKTITSTVWEGIKDTLSAVWTTITGLVRAAADDLGETLSTKWADIKEDVILTILLLQQGITLKFLEIKRDISSKLDEIGSALSDAWQRMSDAALAKFQEISDNIMGGIQGAADAIRGMVGDFIAIGSSLIDGLKQGVGNAIGGLISSVVGAVQGAIQAAWNAIQGGSPSAVFAEMGLSMMQGLALGIEGGSAEALQALIDVLSGLKVEAIESVGKIASGLAGLLSDVREIATQLSTEMPTVILSVKPLLDSLRQIAQDVQDWIATGGGSFAENFEKNILPQLESLVKSIGPVRDLLDTGKSILEAAAAPLPELKRSMETFLRNFTILLTDIGNWVGAHKADWDKGVLWFRTEITPRLAALVEAVKPVGDLLSMAKNVIEIAASPLPELTRSMETFLRSFTILLTDIGNWVEAHKADWDAGVLWFKTEIAPRLAALNEAVQPLQPLLQTAKGVLDIAAAEVPEVKLAVGTLFDNLLAFMESVRLNMTRLITTGGLLQAIADLAGFKDVFEQWTAALVPLQPLLSAVKSVLDSASAEVPEVKLAIVTFFDNLLGVMTAVRDWLGQDTNALSGVLAELLTYKDLFGEWNVALQLLQPLITVTKGILDLAANEAGEVKLKVAIFFDNILGIMAAVRDWLGQDINALNGVLAELLTYKALFGAWNEALQLLQPLLSVAKGILDLAANEAGEVKLAVAVFFNNLLGIMTAVRDWLRQDTSSLSGILTDLLTYKDLFVSWSEALQELQPLLQVAKGILDVAAEEGKSVKLSVQALFDNLKALMEAVSNWVTTQGVAFQTAVIAFKETITPILTTWAEALQPLQGLLSTGKSLMETLSGEIQAMKVNVVAFLGELLAVAKSVQAWVASQGATFASDMAALKDAIVPGLASLQGALEPINGLLAVAEALGKMAVTDLAATFASLGSLMAGIVNGLNAIKAQLEKLDPEAVTNLANRTKDVLKAIFDLASFKPSEIADLSVTFDNAKAIGQRAMDGLLFGLTSNMPALTTATGNIQAALNLGDFYTPGYNTGASLVNGIVAGINARLPDLEAILAYLASLFPHSPAKRGPLAEPINWGFLVQGLPAALAGIGGAIGGLNLGGTAALAPASMSTGAPGGDGGNVYITVTGNTFRDRSDIDYLLDELSRKMRLQGLYT